MFQLALVGYSKLLFIYSRGFLFASVHATILIYFAISFLVECFVSLTICLLIIALLFTQPPKLTRIDILIIGTNKTRNLSQLA